MRPKKRRIFVAIPFGLEAQRGIKKLYKNLKKKHWPVRWEGPEKLHLTIAFLGWVTDKQVEKVASAIRFTAMGRGRRTSQAAIRPFSKPKASADRQVAEGTEEFTVAFKGLGGFPDLVSPRVIWLGLKGDLRSLARLYKEVRLSLERVGFTLEERPFVPHVTLGRMERDTRYKEKKEIGRQLGKLRELDILEPWPIQKITVFESTLSRDGSTYAVVADINFKPGMVS